MADARVLQEFYCATSGGGCGGYLRARVNMALNGIVEVVCPNCGHKHRRSIKDGVLCEANRYEKSPTEELCPTIASWSEDAQHPESKRRSLSLSEERNAVVIEEDSRRFLKEREFELWGDK